MTDIPAKRWPSLYIYMAKVNKKRLGKRDQKSQSKQILLSENSCIRNSHLFKSITHTSRVS